jgi:hypothetical protein
VRLVLDRLAPAALARALALQTPKTQTDGHNCGLYAVLFAVAFAQTRRTGPVPQALADKLRAKLICLNGHGIQSDEVQRALNVRTAIKGAGRADAFVGD